MSLASHLTHLETSGLLRLAQSEPELEYLFRHGLIQDAAYESMVRADRRRLHRVIGETLEALFPERQAELAEVLAHHFTMAGERVKAIAYSRQAARQAEAKYAYEEAAQHLRTALDLTDTETPAEIRLAVLEELADVYQLLRVGVQALARYQQALALWPAFTEADKVSPLRLHRKIIQTVSELRWSTSLAQQAEADAIGVASRTNLEAALQLWATAAPHPEIVHVHLTLANDAWRNRLPPDWEAAERHAQAARGVAEQLGDTVGLSATLGILATIHQARGALRENCQVALQRLALTAGAGFSDLRERVESLRAAGSALMYAGDYAQALPHLCEAEDLAAQIYAIGQQFNALSLQAQCYFRLDRWDAALATESRWRDLMRRYPRERVGVT